MTQHAKLSASAAERWMACPGSVKLSEGVERKGSIYASYGTVLHDIAAYCLRHNFGPDSILSHAEDSDPVRIYLTEAKREWAAADMIRFEVTLDALTKLDPDLGGTADFIRYRPSTHELLVMDFKTGSGVNVEAEDNKQLMIYALGAVLTVGVKAATVRVKIVQPRLDDPDKHIKEWTFPVSQLVEFAADLRAAARATRVDEPAIVPGEVQCRWCPAGEAGRCDKRVKFRPRKPATPVTAADFPTVAS